MESTIIRSATENDIHAISDLIQRTIRITNANDYTQETLQIILDTFTSDKILENMKLRAVFVCCLDDAIVGTASLGATNLHQMFVDPNFQKRGIGASLVDFIEQQAVAKKLDMLVVNSSKTARYFYIKVGFTEIEYNDQRDIPTYKMEKSLGSR